MLVLFKHWFMIQPIIFAWRRTRRHLILSFAEGTAFNHGLSQSGVKRGTSNRKKTFVLIQQRYSIEPPYPEEKSTTCHLSQKDSSKPECFTFVATCQGAAPSRGPVMHHFVVLGFNKTSSIYVWLNHSYFLDTKLFWIGNSSRCWEPSVSSVSKWILPFHHDSKLFTHCRASEMGTILEGSVVGGFTPGSSGIRKQSLKLLDAMQMEVVTLPQKKCTWRMLLRVMFSLAAVGCFTCKKSRCSISLTKFWSNKLWTNQLGTKEICIWSPWTLINDGNFVLDPKIGKKLRPKRCLKKVARGKRKNDLFFDP